MLFHTAIALSLLALVVFDYQVQSCQLMSRTAECHKGIYNISFCRCNDMGVFVGYLILSK